MADERGDEKDQPKADGETLDENAATVQSSQQEDAQSIEIYWTEDRQRRAEPRPFPYQPPTPNQKARARPAMRSRGVNTEMQIPTDPKATPIQSPSNEEESVEALQAYWTEERMTRARPRALLPLKELAPSTKAPTTGPMKTDPMPPDEGVVEALATFETTEVPAAKYRSLPYAPVGKLFMTFNGIDSQATAWTIAESGVFTAGHCLYSKSEGWAKNILFRPQYREGASVGEWVPKYMWIPRGWGEDEDPAYDLAVFQTTKPIRPITGRLGTLANYEPDQGPYKAIGYPAEAVPDYLFDGEIMWQSVGDYISGDTTIKIITAYNNMTGGCSGGPWEVTQRPNYVNGINCHKTSDDTVSTAYFGEAFTNLLRKVWSD